MDNFDNFGMMPLQQGSTPFSKNKFIFDLLLKEWAGAECAELAILVAWLRALSQTHQSNHWTASGDPYYGDHLLFARLYELPNGEVDKFAEKAVGLGSTSLVEVKKLSRHTHSIITFLSKGRPGIPNNDDLVSLSYELELAYKDALEFAIDSMKQNGTASSGVMNLLEQSADDHEGSLYLLKQRMSKR